MVLLFKSLGSVGFYFEIN